MASHTKFIQLTAPFILKMNCHHVLSPVSSFTCQRDRPLIGKTSSHILVKVSSFWSKTREVRRLEHNRMSNKCMVG